MQLPINCIGTNLSVGILLQADSYLHDLSLNPSRSAVCLPIWSFVAITKPMGVSRSIAPKPLKKPFLAAPQILVDLMGFFSKLNVAVNRNSSQLDFRL